MDDMTKQVLAQWAARAMWGITGVLGWDLAAADPSVVNAGVTLVSFGLSWVLSTVSNTFIAKTTKK